MHNTVKILSPARGKSEYMEHSVMALLLVLGLVQIAYVFGASSATTTPAFSKVVTAQQFSGPMLARR